MTKLSSDTRKNSVDLIIISSLCNTQLPKKPFIIANDGLIFIDQKGHSSNRMFFLKMTINELTQGSVSSVLPVLVNCAILGEPSSFKCRKAMAVPTKNLVESTVVRVPTPKPSPSPSQSESSSSSSPSYPATKCSVRTPDLCSAHFMAQNDNKFWRSASPRRLMNYQNGSWIDFSNEVIDSVKYSFVERKPMVIVTIEGSKYVFDFLRMVQIDFETGKQCSIAWIDVNGKCFFPTFFLGEEDEDCVEKSESNTTKVEIEINIKDGMGKRPREMVDEDNEVSEDVLKRQRLNTQGADCSGWLNTRLVKETDKAYTLVRNYFLAGMKKFDAAVAVTSIRQCTRVGHMERARLQVFQKQIEMTKAARGASNTVYAWHGTSSRGVESILAHGFGVPSQISTYGIGVYLSPVGLPGLSARLAEADQNGEKHLILCRVILGNVEKVEAGAQQCYPSSLVFDTGSDDPRNPKWYVVWPSNMNRHVIPECVVSYRSTDHLQGQFKGPNRTTYPLEKLFSKMKSSLSPSKLQEVMNLYHTFRAGKLAKDSFFKQFRSIAGDQILLSAIQEIHASD